MLRSWRSLCIGLVWLGTFAFAGETVALSIHATSHAIESTQSSLPSLENSDCDLCQAFHSPAQTTPIFSCLAFFTLPSSPLPVFASQEIQLSPFYFSQARAPPSLS